MDYSKIMKWQNLGKKVLKIEPFENEHVPPCISKTGDTFFLLGWAKTTGHSEPITLLEELGFKIEENKIDTLLSYYKMIPRLPNTLFIELVGREYHEQVCGLDCPFMLPDSTTIQLGFALYDVEFDPSKSTYFLTFYSRPLKATKYTKGELVVFPITENAIYSTFEKATNTEKQNFPDKMLNKIYGAVFGDYSVISISFYDAMSFYRQFVKLNPRSKTMFLRSSTLQEMIDKFVTALPIRHRSDLTYASTSFYEDNKIYVSIFDFKKFLRAEGVAGFRIPEDLGDLVLQERVRVRQKVGKNKSDVVDKYFFTISMDLYDVQLIPPGEAEKLEELDSVEVKSLLD